MAKPHRRSCVALATLHGEYGIRVFHLTPQGRRIPYSIWAVKSGIRECRYTRHPPRLNLNPRTRPAPSSSCRCASSTAQVCPPGRWARCCSRRTASSSAMDVSTSSCFTAYDARLDRRLVRALRLHERCTHHRGCARRRIGKKGSVPRGTRKWNTTVFHRIPNAPGIRGIRIPFRVFTRIHHVGF